VGASLEERLEEEPVNRAMTTYLQTIGAYLTVVNVLRDLRGVRSVELEDRDAVSILRALSGEGKWPKNVPTEFQSKIQARLTEAVMDREDGEGYTSRQYDLPVFVKHVTLEEAHIAIGQLLSLARSYRNSAWAQLGSSSNQYAEDNRIFAQADDVERRLSVELAELVHGE
jgi:hypothetical protein